MEDVLRQVAVRLEEQAAAPRPVVLRDDVLDKRGVVRDGEVLDEERFGRVIDLEANHIGIPIGFPDIDDRRAVDVDSSFVIAIAV